MVEFKELIEKLSNKNDKAIYALPDKDLKQYAIALYLDEAPIDVVLRRTGLSRTRFYNALRRAGINPNRQGTPLAARTDELEKTAFSELAKANQEIGKLRYKIEMLEQELKAFQL